MIVHRFLATFGDDAIRETNTVKIEVNDEKFIAKGTKTKTPGWHTLYGKFLTLKEEEIPSLKEGEELNIQEIKLHSKETQPPKRYTQASIIKELDKKNLGTKATRSEIIQTLYDRNYIADDQIKATNLGIKTIETLEKYTPEIIDENLTKHFEDEMEQIQEGKRNKDEILKEAEHSLTKVLEKFKEKEKLIGTALGDAYIETRNEISIVGKCPQCKEGDLRITYSKKTKSKFLACNRYPECKTTFSLPRGALIKPTNKECDSCKFPMVLVIRKGKRPWNLCINSSCPKKEDWIQKQQAKQQSPQD